jgi:succinate dehydrogenase / fumarate reductase, cytochrome b subunit
MTTKHPRPTSPHLQIYKLPLTGIISISHRITGVFLSVGLLLIVAIFYVLMQGEGAYIAMQAATKFWLGKLIFWGFVYALYFHLCHGVRHLYWDFGEGFASDTLTKYAIIELKVSLALTVITWIFI